MWGNYTAFGNILNPLFISQYSPAQISLIGVVFVLFGLIGCLIVGTYLDKSKNFKLAIRVLSIGLAIGFVVGIYVIPLGNFYITISFGAVGGILNVPILPATYPYTVLISQPTPPAVVNGYMMTGAQLYAFIFSLFYAWTLSISQAFAISVFAATTCVAALTALLLKKGSPGDNLADVASN